jgi:hypothetical protein
MRELLNVWKPDGVDEVYGLIAFGRPGIGILRASYERAAVVETLSNNGYASAGTESGYDLYRNTSDGSAVALGDETILRTTSDRLEDHVGALESAISVRTGSKANYLETDDDLRVLVDHLGSGTNVIGAKIGAAPNAESSIATIDGVVAAGRRLTIQGAETSVLWDFVYESQNAVDLDALKEYVATRSTDLGYVDDLADPTYTQDGRVALLEGAIDTSEISPQNGGSLVSKQSS